MSMKEDKSQLSQDFPTHEEIMAKGYVKMSRREAGFQADRA